MVVSPKLAVFLEASHNCLLISMYQAFVVLKEAKEEDKRKRATLHKFFKDTETCLHTKMNDKLGALLEQNIGHLDDKISSQKRSLKRKEYVVLVAGR